MEMKYLKISKEDFLTIFLSSALLGVLFGFAFKRFSFENWGAFAVISIFFLFILVLFLTRFIFMKFVAYRNACEISLQKLYWNQFWLMAQDKFSRNNSRLKSGIPFFVLSIIIYIVSFGFLVFPVFWRYTIKKIPHLFTGDKQWLEGESPSTLLNEISEYRYTKVLFSGFVFYVFFFFMVKLFILKESAFYVPFMLITGYLAVFNLIPLPKFEGFELWLKNKFAWYSSITFVFVGIVYSVVLDEFIYLVIFSLFTALLIIFVIFWRKLIK